MSVLIVEDDASLRETLRMILEDEGYQTLEVGNGQEALELLETCKSLPRMILLDLSMPIMNGMEFRRRQLQDTRLAAIPVVVISASGRIEAETPGMRVTESLAKPFTGDALLAIVKRHLHSEGS
jgi:CheY-like chemotaxis protein